MRAVLPVVVAGLVLSSCGIVGGRDTYEVVAYFPRAVSLYKAGAVQVLGLPAGEVTDIEIEGAQVKVTMAVHDDVLLPADVQAALVPQSLIGERRIQLFPPYQQGQPRAEDGHVIEAEDTIIPVEPDEALAALKEFLDSLDPRGVGRLIDNGATALEGRGEGLGAALDELSMLVANIEDNDDDIIAIARRFDDFTETLLTREAQLAQVIDDFAVVTEVLADERDSLDVLVRSLASISESGLDLVSEHAVKLKKDIDIVTRLVAAVGENLDAVQDLVAAGPELSRGFIDAYDPDLNLLNLRNSFGPLTEEALAPIFESAGIPFPCVPVDTVCDGGLVPLDAGTGAVSADVGRPTSPIDDVLDLLRSDTVTTAPAVAADGQSGSTWRRFLHTFLGVGS